MGHPPPDDRRQGRPARLRAADVRPDPACTTCEGTGRFVPEWKAVRVELPCPRCLGGRSVRPVRENWRRIPAEKLEAV